MYFEVVFTGELRAGFTRRQGIEALARQFSLNFLQIKYLLSGERPVVKRFRDRHQAEGIVKALWNGGWHSELCQDARILLCTNQSHEQEVPNAAAGMARKVSADSSISLQLPVSWQICDGLNPYALLQVGDLESHQYAVVLRQDRKELPETLDLAGYSAAQLQQCCAKVTAGEILSDPVALKELAYPAYVAQLVAELGGVAIRYLIACLQWQNWYYTIFLWCDNRDFDKSRELFMTLLKGIHIDSGAPENRRACKPGLV